MVFGCIDTATFSESTYTSEPTEAAMSSSNLGPTFGIKSHAMLLVQIHVRSLVHALRNSSLTQKGIVFAYVFVPLIDQHGGVCQLRWHPQHFCLHLRRPSHRAYNRPSNGTSVHFYLIFANRCSTPASNLTRLYAVSKALAVYMSLR